MDRRSSAVETPRHFRNESRMVRIRGPDGDVTDVPSVDQIEPAVRSGPGVDTTLTRSAPTLCRLVTLRDYGTETGTQLVSTPSAWRGIVLPYATDRADDTAWDGLPPRPVPLIPAAYLTAERSARSATGPSASRAGLHSPSAQDEHVLVRPTTRPVPGRDRPASHGPPAASRPRRIVAGGAHRATDFGSVVYSFPCRMRRTCRMRWAAPMRIVYSPNCGEKRRTNPTLSAATNRPLQSTRVYETNPSIACVRMPNRQGFSHRLGDGKSGSRYNRPAAYVEAERTPKVVLFQLFS
jgi:hypothetical protein